VIDMLKRRLPNNRLFLITLLVLVPIKTFAQDIVLRCDGELSQIWIPSRLEEEVKKKKLVLKQINKKMSF